MPVLVSAKEETEVEKVAKQFNKLRQKSFTGKESLTDLLIEIFSKTKVTPRELIAHLITTDQPPTGWKEIALMVALSTGYSSQELGIPQDLIEKVEKKFGEKCFPPTDTPLQIDWERKLTQARSEYATSLVKEAEASFSS